VIIPKQRYSRIIDVLPVLCVDLIIINRHKKYLLVQRTNEPLKGNWWLVGGRVWKHETIEHAVRRKLREEVGLAAECIEFVGYYENVFKKHTLPIQNGYHAVSLVYKVFAYSTQQIKLDRQNKAWKYADQLPKMFVRHLHGKENFK